MFYLYIFAKKIYYLQSDLIEGNQNDRWTIDAIATKQIVIDDGEHLNFESGYTEFRELLELI